MHLGSHSMLQQQNRRVIVGIFRVRKIRIKRCIKCIPRNKTLSGRYSLHHVVVREGSFYELSEEEPFPSFLTAKALCFDGSEACCPLFVQFAP
mmetsp:Transcript_45060/g.130113  ORF Transcript_45060/g.130113 Transcript_45060/m.130113 type:complete len:93 (-) Transcript_45060:63-341(-)